MGKKTQAAKASLVAAFIAAGGAAATQARAAANPDDASLEGVISSYFGPLGLRDDFNQYLKQNSAFQNFDKWFKYDSQAATRGVITFSFANKIAPPPGFSTEGDPGL
jgi:sugar/nucleoside kinase (ribokinase family)